MLVLWRFISSFEAVGRHASSKEEGKGRQHPWTRLSFLLFHKEKKGREREMSCGVSFLPFPLERIEKEGKWRQAVSVLCFFFLNRHVSLPFRARARTRHERGREKEGEIGPSLSGDRPSRAFLPFLPSSLSRAEGRDWRCQERRMQWRLVDVFPLPFSSL